MTARWGEVHPAAAPVPGWSLSRAYVPKEHRHLGCLQLRKGEVQPRPDTERKMAPVLNSSVFGDGCKTDKCNGMGLYSPLGRALSAALSTVVVALEMIACPHKNSLTGCKHSTASLWPGLPYAWQTDSLTAKQLFTG